MTKTFTVALSAYDGKRYRAVAASVVADSIEQARTIGLEAAKTNFPEKDGWLVHDCSVSEIPPDMLSPAAPIDESASSTTSRRAVFVGDDIMSDVVERLSKSDPRNVQEVAAAQVELLTLYHNIVLEQSRRSFRWALTAAVAAFGFFLAAVAFLLLQQPESVAIVSVVSGALIQVISGINFYLYNKTSAQLADFQARLDRSQRFLLANSVCEGLEGEHKQAARSALVQVIATSQLPQPAAGVNTSDKPTN